MYRDIAKLVLYRDLGEDSILLKLAGIFEDFDKGGSTKAELTTRIYEQIKAILDVSTMYGFDKNLWHNYLTFILLTNENSFSMTSEKVGANDGSVNHFAKGDFRIFKNCLDFRGKYKSRAEQGIKKRLYPEPVPCRKNTFPCVVIYSKSKNAV